MAKDTTQATIALVGEETLLGREMKEVLKARGPDIELEAFAASGEGNFSEVSGETVYVRTLDAASLEGKAAIVVAGSEEGATKAYEAAYEAAKGHGSGPPLKISRKKSAVVSAPPEEPASSAPMSRRGSGPFALTVIDCTGFLAGRPEARLVAPLLQEVHEPDTWLLVVAHPMTSALVLLLSRLSKYRPLRSAVVNVFEPASERGKRGLSELHQQTTALLAFKPLDQDIFDAQLAFNMLSRYGENAAISLVQLEERIAREMKILLQRRANGVAIPMPSLRVIQAPVFHGYSVSIWAEFEADIAVEEIEEALASAQIEVRRSGDDPPHNAGAASQTGLLAGDVRLDLNNRRAAWMWIAADNLRVVADGAMDLLRTLPVVAK